MELIKETTKDPKVTPPSRSNSNARKSLLVSRILSRITNSTRRSTVKPDQVKWIEKDEGVLTKLRFYSLVMMVFCIHTFSILYLVALSAVHLLLTSKIEVQMLRLYDRFSVAVVYGFLALLHMQSLYILCIRVCCFRPKRHRLVMYRPEQLKSGNILQRLWRRSYNWYHTFLGPIGLFGQYGEYYEFRISIREVVEVPAQILQAYDMSQQITYPSISFAFTMIIVLNCITSPLMLSSGKHAVRRQLLVFLDGFFDFIFSVLFQFLIMGIAAYDYIVQENQNVAGHEVHGYKIIHIGSQVTVTSFLDLTTKALPFFFNATLLRSLIHSLCKSRRLAENPDIKETEYRFSLEKIRPRYPTLGRTMDMLSSQTFKRVLKASGIVSALILFAIASEAYYRAPCSQTCSLEIRPWLASPCQCVVRSLNCISENITSANQLEIKIQSLPESIAYLFIRQCSITSPPSKEALSRFRKLERLEIFDTKLRSWDYALDTFSDRLTILNIDGSELTEIPSGLKKLPKSIWMFFMWSKIRALPPPQELEWDNVVVFSLSYLKFTEFPWQLLELSSWEDLDVDGGDLRHFEVPVDLEENPFVKRISLQWNNLQDVPMSFLTKLPSLARLMLDGNNITSLPMDAPSLRLFQQLKTLSLSETPLCSPAYRPQMEDYLMQITKFMYHEVCPPVCSRACPMYKVRSSYCNRPCFTEECGFDGGDCHFYHQTPDYFYDHPSIYN